MGNKVSSPFNPDQDLVEEIREDKYYELLARNADQTVVDVNLATSEYDVGADMSNMWRHEYTILLNNEVPDTSYLILLFPNHPDVSKQVLYTNKYRTLYKLDREINARINASRSRTEAGDLKLAVVCGKQVYRMQGLDGTAYIVWATRVNRKTINAIENTICREMPIFIEMDGGMKLQSAVLLYPELDADSLRRGYINPLTEDSCKYFVPMKKSMFSCETDSRIPQTKHIRTLSFENALQEADEQVNRDRANPDDEEDPFGEDSSEDEFAGQEITMVDGIPVVGKLTMIRETNASDHGWNRPTIEVPMSSDEGKTPRGSSVIPLSGDEGDAPMVVPHLNL